MTLKVSKVCGKTFSLTNSLLFPLWVCDNREPLKHPLSFYIVLTKTAISQSTLKKLDEKILCSCGSLLWLFDAALRIASCREQAGSKQGAALFSLGNSLGFGFWHGFKCLDYLLLIVWLIIQSGAWRALKERPVLPLLRYRQKYQPLARKQQKVKLLNVHSTEVYNTDCFLISLIGPSKPFQLIPFSCHWIWPSWQPTQLAMGYLYVTCKGARQN